MTRKKYNKLVRHLQQNLYLQAKENGTGAFKYCYVKTPTWGIVIQVGKFKGEILKSYEQAWNILSSTLCDTPCFKGLENYR